MKIIDNRGVIIALSDDVKMACPPTVLAEIVASLPPLSMSEADSRPKLPRIEFMSSLLLATNGSLTWKKIHEMTTRPSYASMTSHIAAYLPLPRMMKPSTTTPLDGRTRVNILGAPLRSPAFVEEYLLRKLKKHSLLLYFIEDVA